MFRPETRAPILTAPTILTAFLWRAKDKALGTRAQLPAPDGCVPPGQVNVPRQISAPQPHKSTVPGEGGMLR